MKKILFILSSAALVFTACQKEENENAANNGEGMFLTATVEQQVEGTDTKSTLDGTTVKWSVGDVIRVYNADGTASTDLTATKAGTSSSFSGSDLSSGTPAAAIYPASIAGGYDGTDITFTLPATQTYAANSFGPGANVAVGTVSSGSISFKNVCGVFKLTIYGNYTVSTIELSGKNDEKLNGSYSVKASDYNCTCVTTTTDTEKTLTLDCSSNGETTVGAKDGGVTLSPTTATTFYFVVPVGAFANGFVANVYEKGNTTSYTYTELSTTADNSIIRSRVKAMPESTILPPAYQKVGYLENSTGVAYIDFDALASGISTPITKLEARAKVSLSQLLSGTRQFFFALGPSTISHYLECTAENCFGIYSPEYYNRVYLTAENIYDVNFFIYPELLEVYIDNVKSYSTCTYYSATSITPCRLFQLNNYYQGKYVRIHEYSLYNNDVEVVHFFPAIRKSDSALGMYDLLSNTLLTGSGFDAGSAVTH